MLWIIVRDTKRSYGLGIVLLYPLHVYNEKCKYMCKNTKNLPSFIGLIVILLFTSLLLSLSYSSRHNITAALILSTSQHLERV